MKPYPEKGVTRINTLKLDHSQQKEVPGLTGAVRVLLMRHGETPGNKKCIVQGCVNEGLSEKGIAQVAAVSTILSDDTMDLIYSSDLQSAVESAELIGKDHSVQVLAEKALREQNLGAYQGTTVASFLRTMRRAKETAETFCPEEGEAPEIFRKRAIDIFLEVIAEHQDKTILLVTHTGVIRCIVNYLFGSGLPRGFLNQGLRNASVTDLRLNPNEVSLNKIYIAV